MYALGWASFLADVASEMIYPVLPRFLAALGAARPVIGLIEGLADATASTLKVVSGFWSDRVEKKRPLVMLGYGLSAFAKPPIGLVGFWPPVLALRFLDRVGKGIRTSPRDALIAQVTDPSVRGRAYGLHRAMDHAGAVVGPLIGAALIALWSVSDRTLFLVSGIPAFAVLIVLWVFIREERRTPSEVESLPILNVWSDLGGSFRAFLLAVVVFALGNSTDAFLILRMSDLGVAPALISILWSAHHVIKMSFSIVGGRLADKLGAKTPILFGWAVYAIVYLAFGFVHDADWIAAIFICYGVYHGFAEPSEKAMVAQLVPERIRGSAFGVYHGSVGICVLPASLSFGFLWHLFGPAVAFGFGAGMAGLAAALLLRVSQPARTARLE